MVLVPKSNKKKILMHLFNEGVLTCKKDGMKREHDDIKEVPNLHVMMVMKSLASKGLVKYKFNWQWFYYYLTDEGIAELREQLHLPASVSPQTLTKPQRAQRFGGEDGERGERKGKGKGKGKGFGKKGGWSSGKGKGKGKGGDYGSEEKAEEAAPAEE